MHGAHYMEIAKKHQDKLDGLKKDIEKAYDYFQPNYKRFHEYKKFIFDTSWTSTDLDVLARLQKPQLEFNMGEAYLSRMRGEFYKQEPSIKVTSDYENPVDPKIIDIVEGHFRHILCDANKNSFEYDVYTDMLSGGFSVARIWTEYLNSLSFNQVIKLGKHFDPTLCGFDPLARLPSKSDGRFCFELIPMNKEDFLREYKGVDISSLDFSRTIGSFNWNYNNNKEDIILVCHMYVKKKEKVKIIELTNKRVMTDKSYKRLLKRWDELGLIEQAPQPTGKSRMSDMTTICRYELISNQVLSYEETDYKMFPLIFFDGNSAMLKDGDGGDVRQMTRSYLHHTRGTQRLKNFAGVSLANEIENSVMSKWIIADESILPAYKEAIKNPQSMSAIIYRAFKAGDPQVALPPPQAVPRVPCPPEFNQTFVEMDGLMQTILGSYDASIGVNENDISGKAMIEGATQSNATAMPYVVGFMNGLTPCAEVILDLIPKYLVSPRKIPVVGKNGEGSDQLINAPGGISMNYPENSLQVSVEAGVNFAVQKNRALQMLNQMSASSPMFAKFISDMGLEVVIDNMEIRGADQLKVLAKQWMQEQKQQQQMAMQQQQQNPSMMRAHNDQQRLLLDANKNQTDAQLKASELLISQQNSENARMKIMSDMKQAEMESMVQLDKSNTEKLGKAAELAMSATDMNHRHNKEGIELRHSIEQSLKETSQPSTPA